MKVVVFPRDSNPYQNDLYGAMASSRPIEVDDLNGPTGSQTLNVLLLPGKLGIARLRGFEILHVHWLYPFSLHWARSRRARRLVELWFHLFLNTAVLFGFKIVWTVHNVVPHEPVFTDDLAAGRTLAQRCDVVIAHSREAAAIVGSWDVSNVAVIHSGIATMPEPPMPARSTARAELGLASGAVRVLFFGMIREYKGVDLLIKAVDLSEPDLPLDVAIVGECSDRLLRTRLHELAVAISDSGRLHTQFAFVSEIDLARHLAAADFAVFPFREVTNSSSVGQALAGGLPVIIPALPMLDEIPEDVAIRYEPGAGRDGLVDALATAATMGESERAAMVNAARRFVMGRTWPEAAAATWRVYDDLFSPLSSSTVTESLHSEVTG